MAQKIKNLFHNENNYIQHHNYCINVGWWSCSVYNVYRLFIKEILGMLGIVYLVEKNIGVSGLTSLMSRCGEGLGTASRDTP